ncbi:conserved unknown protein [Ectocarpus siliculosus]|uniref:Uncharacterized protein n=1 Tax=Ectocarpus siliculosus TaxID=2880 RepID=D8LRR4_ECTSI|nr:conserved unknown protein [Ectocarpus siliculosus]|eukprot:CBN73831.1 conserved unknown protein [Ectocarpus siliculosus]
MLRQSVVAVVAAVALLGARNRSAEGFRHVGVARSGRARPDRCQSVGKLSASPMEKFMSGLEKMMTGPQLEGSMDTPQEQEQQEEPQDMSAFRESLIRQSRKDSLKKKEEFTGYDMYDLIVDKFDVPYDVQINKTVWMGKPVLCFNIMWKHLGQSSFPLSEQEYLEHLQALAELLMEWDRVDQFKRSLADTKKRPQSYFGYAVALPLDLDPDTMVDYFDDSYF